MKKLFIVLFLLPFVLNFAQDETKPIITTSARNHSFGELREGQIVSHTFKVYNKGNADLVIEKVRSSCGCTGTNLGKNIIPPGDSTTIRAEFNSSNRKGNQKKHVYIFSNDPSIPKLPLTFTATVYGQNDNIAMIKKGPKLKLSTNQIRFGKVNKGEILERKINFKNIGQYPLKISEIKAACDCITAIPNKYQFAPDEVGYADLKIDTSELQGTVARTIVFRSNDPLGSNQVVTIFITINKEK